MDYTTLSLSQVKAGLDTVGRETQAEFGRLNSHRLNWQPDPARWSVGQCFEHLLVTNRFMLKAALEALDDARRRTIWQRLPGLPRVLGRALVRSQTPGTKRKFTAPPKARPARSDIAGDIIPRFVTQHKEVLSWLDELDQDRASRTIMASPFLKVITYSVLDGFRLMVAHDRRHFEQARQVTLSPGFP